VHAFIVVLACFEPLMLVTVYSFPLGQAKQILDGSGTKNPKYKHFSLWVLCMDMGVAWCILWLSTIHTIHKIHNTHNTHNAHNTHNTHTLHTQFHMGRLQKDGKRLVHVFLRFEKCLVFIEVCVHVHMHMHVSTRGVHHHHHHHHYHYHYHYQ